MIVQGLIGSYNNGAAGPADPFFALVTSLLHFSGANGSITFTDQIPGVTWSGSAVLSTAQFVVPPSSAFFSSTNKVTPSLTQLSLNATEYTVEGFCYSTNGSGDKAIYDNRSGGQGIGIYIHQSGSGLSVANNAAVIANGAAFLTGAWMHWAVCQDGAGTLEGFVGDPIAGTGTRVFSTTDSRGLASSTSYWIGMDTSTTQPYAGYLGEFRVTKKRRYTGATYTVPTTPFPDH